MNKTKKIKNYKKTKRTNHLKKSKKINRNKYLKQTDRRFKGGNGYGQKYLGNAYDPTYEYVGTESDFNVQRKETAKKIQLKNGLVAYAKSQKYFQNNNETNRIINNLIKNPGSIENNNIRTDLLAKLNSLNKLIESPQTKLNNQHPVSNNPKKPVNSQPVYNNPINPDPVYNNPEKSQRVYNIE